MKEFLKNNKKYLKETAIIIIIGIIINIACFLMPLVVHAENSESSSLPYLPNSYENTLSRAELVDIIGTLSSAGYTLGDNTIIFRTYEYTWYTYNDYIQAPSYIIYDFSNINNVSLTYYGCTYSTFEYNNSSMYVRVGTAGSSGITQYKLVKSTIGSHLYNGYSVSQSTNAFFDMFGVATMTQVSNRYFEGEFNNKYPVYTTFVLKDLNGNDVLSNYHDTIPTTSDFEPAPNSPNVTPNTPPTSPTITTPAIDSSQSLIDNIKALFNWLGDTIKSLLAWLIEYIMYFFNNLTYNIKAFIDAVIHAINNGFANVYNNIRDFFSPAINFLMGAGQAVMDFINNLDQLDFHAYIKQRVSDIVSGIQNLVDSVFSIKNFLTGTQGFFETYGVIWNQETWEEALDSSPWITAVTDNTTTMSQFINGTLNVAEPQTLEFSFDFRNAHYNFGLCTFNFDWYLPYKNSVRLAFLTICILNAVLYFFDEAPNWFSGGGSNKKGDK